MIFNKCWNNHFSNNATIDAFTAEQHKTLELRLPLNKSQTGLSTTLSNNAPLYNQGVKVIKKIL